MSKFHFHFIAFHFAVSRLKTIRKLVKRKLNLVNTSSFYSSGSAFYVNAMAPKTPEKKDNRDTVHTRVYVFTHIITECRKNENNKLKRSSFLCLFCNLNLLDFWGTEHIVQHTVNYYIYDTLKYTRTIPIAA